MRLSCVLVYEALILQNRWRTVSPTYPALILVRYFPIRISRVSED